jgi:hypothetical protein
MRISGLISGVRTPEVLPDAEEIRDAVYAMAALSKAVSIREIGASAEGRSIQLVEVGDGPRSALIVGAPHPNEPIGCLTILAMIELFVRNPELVVKTGFRWNFIPCIEPDGLTLNRGWLKGPRTPEHYLEHFYRPSFDRQAEYTFPMHVDGWRFDKPTPENLAWRLALVETKPALLVSLHNAEYGGVYYVLSRALPELAGRLAAHPDQADLTLNNFGDPFLDVARISPGVFHFWDLAAVVRQAKMKGKDLSVVWQAGDSSAGYAKGLFGTLSIVAETPYWEDMCLRDHSKSSHRLSDVSTEAATWSAENFSHLEGSLEALTRGAPPYLEPIISALREVARCPPQITDGSQPSVDPVLSVAEYTLLRTSLRLVSLRPMAMLARLARGVGLQDEASAAWAAVTEGLADLRMMTSFNIIPLEKLVRLQMNGIFAGAEALSSETRSD